MITFTFYDPAGVEAEHGEVDSFEEAGRRVAAYLAAMADDNMVAACRVEFTPVAYSLAAATSFELTFWGDCGEEYQRVHPDYDSAEREAYRVLASLDNRAAHPAIIHGPGLGPDGKAIP